VQQLAHDASVDFIGWFFAYIAGPDVSTLASKHRTLAKLRQ
jgi:hypothetical protein